MLMGAVESSARERYICRLGCALYALRAMLCNILILKQKKARRL